MSDYLLTGGYQMLKVFNTFTREYVEVEVTEEIETEVKRSYWREEQQMRRYHKRCSLFYDEVGYSLDEFDGGLCSSVIEHEEALVVTMALKELDSRLNFIINKVYFEGCNLAEVSRMLGVSSSYMSRLHKRALNELRSKVLERYNYLV